MSSSLHDRRLARALSCLVLTAGLSACGGGSSGSDRTGSGAAAYHLGGAVVGLTKGGLVLSNGGITLGVASGAGSFTFDSTFTGGYRVTVLAQPDGQTCSVSGGSGSSSSDVTSVQVICRSYAAYVAHAGSQTLAQFSVADDGSLSPMATATLALTYQPAGMAVRGDGTLLWLRYGNHRQITALAADPTSGALSLVGYTPAYSNGYGLALNPSLDVLYSGDYGGATVSQFSYDSTGLLVAMSTPRLAAEVNPKAVAVTPEGRWVFVANASSDSVSQYSVGSDGALTLPTVASVSTAGQGSGPAALAVDPAGSRLFVLLESSNRLLQYGIGNSGLTYERASTTGSQPVAIAVTPDGAHAYVANRSDSSLTQYTLAGRAVTSLGSVVTCSQPAALAISPDGTHLYVACAGDATVRIYAIASDGLLTLNGSIAAGGLSPSAIAVR
jgi:6-phosphogluconolactonase (cycloisomerase 2 family)